MDDKLIERLAEVMNKIAVVMPTSTKLERALAATGLTLTATNTQADLERGLVCAQCKGSRDDLAPGREPEELCDPCYDDATASLQPTPAEETDYCGLVETSPDDFDVSKVKSEETDASVERCRTCGETNRAFFCSNSFHAPLSRRPADDEVERVARIIDPKAFSYVSDPEEASDWRSLRDHSAKEAQNIALNKAREVIATLSDRSDNRASTQAKEPGE